MNIVLVNRVVNGKSDFYETYDIGTLTTHRGDRHNIKRCYADTAH